MIKKLVLAAALLGIIFYCLQATQPDTSAYLALVQKARTAKNQSFRQSKDSPLSTEQKAEFDSLKYYPTDPSFVLNASVSRNETPDTVLLQMSDDRAEKYLNWGLASFTLDNQPQKLRLYVKANGTDAELFVPFTDLTNGHDSYGGGRYLDVPRPKADAAEMKLDFNTAYNPYCAYNTEYSCPVPPAENRLRVAIAAGEKSFHD